MSGRKRIGPQGRIRGFRAEVLPSGRTDLITSGWQCCDPDDHAAIVDDLEQAGEFVLAAKARERLGLDPAEVPWWAR